MGDTALSGEYVSFASSKTGLLFWKEDIPGKSALRLGVFFFFFMFFPDSYTQLPGEDDLFHLVQHLWGWSWEQGLPGRLPSQVVSSQELHHPCSQLAEALRTGAIVCLDAPSAAYLPPPLVIHCVILWLFLGTILGPSILSIVTLFHKHLLASTCQTLSHKKNLT